MTIFRSLSFVIGSGLVIAAGALHSWAPFLEGARGLQPTVVREAMVSESNRAASLVEPTVAAGRSDPTHLIAAGISVVHNSITDSTVHCAFYFSGDAGEHWRAAGETAQRCGDPWLAIGTTGLAHFAMLGPGGELMVFRSLDGGASWPPTPAVFGRNHDHPTLAVGPAHDGEPGALYVLSNRGSMNGGKLERFTISVVRSDDEGATFGQAFEVTPSNLNQNSLTIATLTDGTVVAPFFDFMQNVNGFKNGGWLDRPRLWVLTSTDRGKSFSVPLLATERCASRLGGFPATAVDWSPGPFRDRVYLSCRTARGIAVLWSADHGEHWSEPTEFVTDLAAIERGELGAIGLAVNREGRIGVTWKQRRGMSAGRCQDLFFAVSGDGGTTFSAPLRVTSAPSCSTALFDSASAARWPEGGDYGSLVATSDGLFHMVWADARSGRFQLWSGAVRVP